MADLYNSKFTGTEIDDILSNVPKKTSDLENDSNFVEESEIQSAIDSVTEIANGKCACYVFDTISDLDTWLSNTNNTRNLKTGDVFLVRAVDVPDYWWDGTTNTKQILETTKIDLSEYALKTQIPTSLPAEGGNADTVDGVHIAITTTAPTTNDTSLLTFVKQSGGVNGNLYIN